MNKPHSVNSTEISSSQRWYDKRLPTWQRVEEQIPQLEQNQPTVPEVALQAAQEYPEIARDLAIARRIAPKAALTRVLEKNYTALHRVIFRKPRSTKEDLRNFLLREIPEVTWHLMPQILAVTIGFIIATLAGWLLISEFPDLTSLFASQTMIDKVRGGELWTDDLLNVFPSSLLSIQIFTNNIMVALSTMCLGILYGLGTIYIIGLNGLMLGGIFAFTAQYGMAGNLFKFVAAHGFVELSVICVAGAIGFSLGESIARPRHLTRTASFQQAVSRNSKLMLLCVVFLIGAGLIEGYVSPNDAFSLNRRLVIGIGYWLLFAFALCGWRLPRLGAELSAIDK